MVVFQTVKFFVRRIKVGKICNMYHHRVINTYLSDFFFFGSLFRLKQYLIYVRFTLSFQYR